MSPGKLAVTAKTEQIQNDTLEASDAASGTPTPMSDLAGAESQKGGS